MVGSLPLRSRTTWLRVRRRPDDDGVWTVAWCAVDLPGVGNGDGDADGGLGIHTEVAQPGGPHLRARFAHLGVLPRRLDRERAADPAPDSRLGRGIRLAPVRGPGWPRAARRRPDAWPRWIRWPVHVGLVVVIVLFRAPASARFIYQGLD